MKRLFIFSLIVALTICAKAYDFKQNGICYNILSVKDKTVEITDDPDKYIGAIKIEETVDFEGTTYTVIGVGVGAFHNCQGLTSVVLPETITSIGESAFSVSHELTKLEIPKSVTYIGQFAFHYCDNLKSAVIPPGVTFLYPCTFENCTNLESITLPIELASIGLECFSGCKSLTEINLPDSLRHIDDMAFANCNGIKMLAIPENVYFIGEFAFGSCEALECLEIKPSLTIAKRAFSNCNSISSIKLYSSEPQPISNDAFPGIVKLNATLYVPQGAKTIFEGIDGWNDFANIVELEDSGIRATRSDATGGKAYRLNGTPATESDKGIIIHDGKKTVQK